MRCEQVTLDRDGRVRVPEAFRAELGFRPGDPLVVETGTGGRVWQDTDGNGLQGDPEDEPGIEGVTVTLTRANQSTEQATTDSDGQYVFAGALQSGDTITVSKAGSTDQFTTK